MADGTTLPVISPDGSLSRYLQDISKFPMLEKQEEYMLGKAWQDHGDTVAAHKLVTSHLRLVAKIAMGYRGYGLPVGELVSEGNVGLMKAVKKFDPDRGFRLSTYAMWWIKASIQEFVLRSWSLVKIGTTAAQKKLFFNLRRVKGQIKAIEEGDLSAEHVEEISTKLNVSQSEVVDMNRRLSGADSSLNAPIKMDGEGEWMDWLEDEQPNQEIVHAENEELDIRRSLMLEAMKTLNPREQNILTKRRLEDTPLTLEQLSVEYNISRERVRQIEVRAFEKLQKAMVNASK